MTSHSRQAATLPLLAETDHLHVAQRLLSKDSPILCEHIRSPRTHFPKNALLLTLTDGLSVRRK